MRVALLGFHHESNTFAPVAASLEQFLAAGPVQGPKLDGPVERIMFVNNNSRAMLLGNNSGWVMAISASLSSMAWRRSTPSFNPT